MKFVKLQIFLPRFTDALVKCAAMEFKRFTFHVSRFTI
jgi:hypothetical protein